MGTIFKTGRILASFHQIVQLILSQGQSSPLNCKFGFQKMKVAVLILLATVVGLDGIKVADIVKSCAAAKTQPDRHCFGYSTKDAPESDQCNQHPSKTTCPSAFASVTRVDVASYQFLIQLVGKTEKGSGWVGMIFYDENETIDYNNLEAEAPLGLGCVPGANPKVQFLFGHDDELENGSGLVTFNAGAHKKSISTESIALDDGWIVCTFILDANAGIGGVQLLKEVYKIAFVGNNLNGSFTIINPNANLYITIARPNYITSSKVEVQFFKTLMLKKVEVVEAPLRAFENNATTFLIQAAFVFALLALI